MAQRTIQNHVGKSVSSLGSGRRSPAKTDRQTPWQTKYEGWFDQYACTNHAVDLFFGLRSQTPENGNNLRVAWRIWPGFAVIDRNSEPGRLTPASKAHGWRAFLIQKIIFCKIQTAWLTTQSSANRSRPLGFPYGKFIGNFAEVGGLDGVSPGLFSRAARAPGR